MAIKKATTNKADEKNRTAANKIGTGTRIINDTGGKHRSSGILASSAVRSGVRRAQIEAGKKAPSGSKYAQDNGRAKEMQPGYWPAPKRANNRSEMANAIHTITNKAVTEADRRAEAEIRELQSGRGKKTASRRKK